MTEPMPPESPEVPEGPLSPAPEAEAPSGLSLTPEQVSAMFGGPVEPGASMTVTLVAGDVGPGGSVSFDVVSDDSSEDAAEGESDDMGMPPITEDDPEVTKALGYDRSAVEGARRKRATMPINPKDLEED